MILISSSSLNRNSNSTASTTEVVGDSFDDEDDYYSDGEDSVVFDLDDFDPSLMEIQTAGKVKVTLELEADEEEGD